MTDPDTAAQIGGVALLERAMGYTLGNLNLVTPAVLGRPTPCADWDVRTLLVHMADSLDVLCDAVDIGVVPAGPIRRDGGAAAELVSAVRDRACRLLAAWTGIAKPATVSVYGRPLSSTIVASTGALEVAVHGWDVARGCGHDRAIHPSLAEELGELALLIVTREDRPHRFGLPVAVAQDASPSDQLVAMLGRDPAAA
jgi:uncharacterized protein (TIGR03086 family)